MAQQEVDENGYSYPEPPKELQLNIERRPRPTTVTTTQRPRAAVVTTTEAYAEAPLPIYGAPSQPFRAGFGTRTRNGRIVKVRMRGNLRDCS